MTDRREDDRSATAAASVSGGEKEAAKSSGDFAGQVLERAYEHAMRMLDRDAEILDQMRTRSSFLLAALAIGGTVLGAILSGSSHSSPPWWVLIWLGLALVPCIAVLWPTRDRGKLTSKWAPDDTTVRKFRIRWAEVFQARKPNERLWKIGLTGSDLDNARASAQNEINKFDQILVDTMRRAHKRNDRTLTRRADLLRVASLLILIFFVTFSIWL
jgi:hypothetical protein